jgi:tetratricopeptide (TPR) repeat protein
MEAKYDVASAHNNYADLLEKSGRAKEALTHRQIVLEAIVPLEKKENNPELYTADFFEFYAKYAAAAAKLGQKDIARKYCEKAEALNFNIAQTSVETKNLYGRDIVLLGNAYLALGEKAKAKASYQTVLDTWNELKTTEKIYPSLNGDLAALEQTLRALS